LISFVKAQSFNFFKQKRKTYEVSFSDSSDRKTKLEIIEENRLTCPCLFNKQWGIRCSGKFFSGKVSSIITFEE